MSRAKSRCLILCMLLGIPFRMSSQCVVINEVLINAAGACDGNCVPNTAEWLELRNTCDSPVDLSCFVLTDGDFAVTFPTGTSIAANGYLVVGSNNSNVNVDVNLATCNCTSGNDSEIGIFTNGNEQIALANASGQIIDGIYWGGEQFEQTPNFTTDTQSGCPPQTINLSASNPWFNIVPEANDGETVYRSCMNSVVWLADGQNYTPGAANGVFNSLLSITASDSSPCPGQLVVLTAHDALYGVVWNTGSSSMSISIQQSGIYSVTQYNFAGCASHAEIEINYLTAPPVNAGEGGLVDCDEELQLQGSTTATDFYWEPSTGLSDPFSLTPVASPLITTTYILHALGEECESFAFVEVVSVCGSLKVPNIFTPNGDSYNEVFRPEGRGVVEYSLQIYDRWGMLVFESSQLNVGWNGKINGTDAAEGTYYFLLIAKNAQGDSLVGNEVMEGEVELVR